MKHENRLIIPEGTKAIMPDAFWCRNDISELVLPDSLIFIGMDAFNECDSLEMVHFGAGLREISSGAFRYCEKLVICCLRSSIVFARLIPSQ